MSKESWYRQCDLERKADQRTQHLTTWLPERYAKKGKVLRLRHDGVWIDGWRVVAVGSERRTEGQTIERSRDYMHQRDASDA